jgi:hypothetical protein
MTRLGTAFVDVQADFSQFDKQVSRELAGRFKAVGERSGKDFSDGFNRDTTGLLLPFTRDLDKTVASAGRSSAAVKKVTQAINETAGASNAFARDAAASEAAGKIREEFANLSPAKRLDLKLAGANAEVEALRAHLVDLAKQEPTIEVKVAIAKAIADLDRAELKVREVSAQRAEIKVDVDQSAFARIKDAIGGLFTAVGGSGGGGLTGATTRLSAGFLSFGSSIGPVVALLGALAVTIGVSLVGAFAALVASMALAAAGAAALGAALAAALGPVVVLGVAVASRVAKVFEALKAQDTAASEIGRKTAAGSAAAAAAGQQLASAERAQTEAARQLGIARSNAYREMADAAEQAKDAVAGVTTAQISLDRAKLSTERARLELDKFKQEAGATGKAFGAVFTKFTDVSTDTSGLKKALAAANAATGGKLDKTQELDLRDKVLQVREARDQEKQAVDGVHDATVRASRAQADDNKFKREGIKASEGYRSALRGVEAAALAVRAAQDSPGASTAQQKAIDLTGKLSKREQQLLAVVKKVRDELRGAFTPATDAVFGGVIKAAGRLPQLINPLRGNFKRLGEAVGRSFDKVSKGLVTPESISKLKDFTNAARDLTGPVTDGISALSDILTDIARATLPFLVDGARKVARQLQDWSKATGNTRKLDKTIGSLVGHLKTWLGVGAAIGDVFLAFLESAAGPGKGLADSIKSLAERTATWLRSTEGRKELAQFFKDAIAFASDFARFMGVIILATIKFGQVAAHWFAVVTDKVGGARNMAKAVLVTFGTLAAFKLGRGIVTGFKAVQTAMVEARKAATLLHASWNAGRLAAIRERAALIASRVATVAMTVASKAFAAAQWLVNLALRANPIGLVVTALVALGVGLVEAYKHSETFRRIVNGAFTAVRKVAVEAIQVVIGALDRLLGVYSTVATGLSKVPLIGGKFKGAADAIDHARERLRAFAKSLDEVAKIKDLKIVIDADISPDLRKLLRHLDDKATSKVGKVPPVPGLRRATGGPIPGVGSRDTVPALLTPGEFVTRKRIVERFGTTIFADINAGRLDPRVGYQAGERPSLTARPVRGPRYATGGPVGAGVDQPRITNITAPITVPGGGPPDPVALSVQLARLAERRAGGDPGNW